MGQDAEAEKAVESELRLLEAMSEEIRAYRQRQLTTFRETVIVLALVTWGVGELLPDAGPNQSVTTYWLRLMAALGCLAVGALGVAIIHSYKQRIYHMRDRRIEQAWACGYDHEKDPFVPTSGDGRDYLSQPFWKSSSIYSSSLVVFSLIAVIANSLLAWNAWCAH